MPYIVIGEPTSTTDFSRINHDYEYPNNLDLKPGSDFHKKLKNKIWQRARESRNEISKRFDSWKYIDKKNTVYIDLKKDDKKLKDKDPDKPISIVFPYSYTMLEALLTYMTLAFFQDPMFRYEGVEDDDVIGAMLLEMVIKIHCIKSKVLLNVHTAFRDNFNYGIGVAIPTWSRIFGKRPIRNSIISESELGTSETEQVEFIDDVLFEGNELQNIDAYMWLPDPNVSSDNTQKGEFIGWVERDNYMDMLTEENSPDSGIFNVKYLKEVKNKRSTFALDESDREKKYGKSTSKNLSDSTNIIDNINMYIKLIPKDWKLSESENPEIWLFRLSSDDVITKCERATHNHGMFPVAVASSEFDGYSSTPIGRMEILSGLQGTLDFLFNSHIKNVRKAINDMLIVDPYLVNINDVKNPEPGKIIRLRRPAWGRGVDKVIQQLQVTDITRLNIADSTYVTQWMDRISGADQSMQGTLRQGGPERLTRAEFQGTRGSSVSRLQRIAMIIGTQFMQDIGTMFAVHTQQYMKKEMFVKVTGRYQDKLQSIHGKERIKVSPYDLAVNYDLIVRDGSIPGGNFSEAWIEIFRIMSSSPTLMQEFDITRIFMYIANQLGAKNVEDFRKVTNNAQTSVISDEEAEAEAARGNIVPIGEA